MSSYYDPGNPNSWNTIEPDPLGNWAFLRKPSAQWGISAAGALAVVIVALALVPFVTDIFRPWRKIREPRFLAKKEGINCLLCDTFLVTEFYVFATNWDFATGLPIGLRDGDRFWMGGIATGKLICSLAAAGFIVFAAKSSLAGKFPPFQSRSPYALR